MQEGDEVIVSNVEHHSNIVPWQILAQRRGIVLKVIPINDEGQFDMDAFQQLITEKTKLVSVAHVSNVMGTINPVREIIRIAHVHDIPVMLDGAQSVPHFPVDVQELDCEFLAFSGHKVYGPTGYRCTLWKGRMVRQATALSGWWRDDRACQFQRYNLRASSFEVRSGYPRLCSHPRFGNCP